MKRTLVALIAAIAWTHSTDALALPPAAQLDPTFGDAGITTLGFDLGGGNNFDLGTVVVTDAQDRLYVVGSANEDDATCLGTARFLPDGTLDTEHYGNGVKICRGPLPGGSQVIAFDALIQPNGMLVVEGLDFVGDLGTPIICRFDTPGHLDSAGFGAPSTPGCVAFENIESQFGFPFIDVPFPGLRAISIALHDQRIIAAMNHVISPDDQTTLFARLSSDGEVIPFRQEQTAAVFSPGPEWGEYHVADAVMTGNGKLVLTGATDSPELNG